MQGARMSGRSTPLAGYPEQYRMEGRMGWLAAFGTAGYPDGSWILGPFVDKQNRRF